MGYLEIWTEKLRAMRVERDNRHQDAWDTFMIEAEELAPLEDTRSTPTRLSGRPFRPTRAALVSREPASVRGPQPAGI